MVAPFNCGKIRCSLSGVLRCRSGKETSIPQWIRTISPRSAASHITALSLIHISSNLSDKAKECIEEVKSTGKVTVLKDYGPVDAVLSNNEKYLMIYQDSQNDEQALTRKAEITEIVKTFE